MSLEEAELLNTNNTKLEIANEGNERITDEQISFKGLDVPTLCHYDEGNNINEEGNTIFFNECYEFQLKNWTKEKIKKCKILNTQKGCITTTSVKLMIKIKKTQAKKNMKSLI